MSRRARLLIVGMVQGVFYRVSTRDHAKRLGLSGWVRNRLDGSVEAFAIGPADKIEALVEWCRQGPPSARVDSVSLEWVDSEEEVLPDTGDFVVRDTA